MRNHRAQAPEFHRPTRTAERARFLRAVLDLGSSDASDDCAAARTSPPASPSTSEAADAPSSDGTSTGESEDLHPAS